MQAIRRYNVANWGEPYSADKLDGSRTENHLVLRTEFKNPDGKEIETRLTRHPNDRTSIERDTIHVSGDGTVRHRKPLMQDKANFPNVEGLGELFSDHGISGTAQEPSGTYDSSATVE